MTRTTGCAASFLNSPQRGGGRFRRHGNHIDLRGQFQSARDTATRHDIEVPAEGILLPDRRGAEKCVIRRDAVERIEPTVDLVDHLGQIQAFIG